MYNHTPGPWRVYAGGTQTPMGMEKFVIWGESDTTNPVICTVHCGVGLQTHANAAIIAVSPALLQAAKCALADLEGLTGYKHKALPAYRRNEKRALTTIRELTAAIQAAEPEGNSIRKLSHVPH